MKKFLIILVLLISTSVFTQTSLTDTVPYTRLVSQQDLPIGESFVVLPQYKIKYEPY